MVSQQVSLRAHVVLEALPYIRKFYGKTIVIKYGGAAQIDLNLAKEFARDVVLLKYVGMNPVIVHGGGPEITRFMEKMGKKSEFVNGVRVTDAETVEMAEMVLSGKISKSIVSMINHAGGRAVSLSGKDGNLILAKRLRGGRKDMGFVGQITGINPAIIESLDKSGFIPVISSIAAGEEAESLNINADEAASAIAVALKAIKLIYLTDVDGIQDKDGELLARLSLSDTKALIRKKVIVGGMLPKAKCCMEAVANGVMSAHVIDGRIMHSVLLELFTDTGIGTMIKPGITPHAQV